MSSLATGTLTLLTSKQRTVVFLHCDYKVIINFYIASCVLNKKKNLIIITVAVVLIVLSLFLLNKHKKDFTEIRNLYRDGSGK